MPRFFVTDRNLITKNDIIIEGNDVKHIKNVLRLKVGDKIQVCDGEKTDYEVEIFDYKDSCVITRIISRLDCINEPKHDITIFQGIPKSDKMDFIVKKSVELGVNSIVPVITDRTIKKFEKQKDKEKKLERWSRIAYEAAKQSKRGIVPEILMPVSYVNAIEMSKKFDSKMIFYENEEKSNLKKFINYNRNCTSMAFFVGPEGGFTSEEVAMAKSKEIRSISLGRRILRTETVCMAVLSIIMYELEDI